MGAGNDYNRTALISESLMHKRYGDRAFADCRSDALHVAGADVSDRKDARQAGFK